jgi:predicted DNA-binding transcriptional regulator YafY
MKTHRVHRLLKLITLLRAERGRDAETLAREVGVGRRTLFRDLSLLKSAGIAYQFDSTKNVYSLGETPLLPPVHLDAHEALALMLITRRFLARQVHPLYQKALDAAIKIESQLSPELLRHCGMLVDGISVRWHPVSDGEAANDVFLALQRALAQRVRVNVQYDSVQDSRRLDLLLDPLRLVFVSRAWYLIAWSHLHGSPRTFKLERMVRVQVTAETFEPHPDFDEARYFGSAWRMIPEGQLYHVKLRFCPAVATSVEEVRWHDSQATHRDDDGGLIFEVDIDGLGEIAAWVLGYGEHVTVIEPPALRDLVVEKATKLLAAHRGNGHGGGA